MRPPYKTRLNRLGTLLVVRVSWRILECSAKMLDCIDNIPRQFWDLLRSEQYQKYHRNDDDLLHAYISKHSIELKITNNFLLPKS